MNNTSKSRGYSSPKIPFIVYRYTTRFFSFSRRDLRRLDRARSLLGGSDALLGVLDDVRLGDAELLVQDGGGRGRTERVNANVLPAEAQVPIPAERGAGLNRHTRGDLQYSSAKGGGTELECVSEGHTKDNSPSPKSPPPHNNRTGPSVQAPLLVPLPPTNRSHIVNHRTLRGRTLSLYSALCFSNSSMQGMDTTRTLTPSLARTCGEGTGGDTIRTRAKPVHDTR